jgi:hypothetical protein
MPSYIHDEVASMTSEERKDEDKKYIESLKSVDRGYHVLKRVNPEWVQWANERRSEGLRVYKRKDLKPFFKMEVYSSGEYIRNAVTGQRTNIKVGSNDEDIFFSVIICTGENGQESITLFYISPEEYERQHRCILSQESKERWYHKNLAYRQQHNFEI